MYHISNDKRSLESAEWIYEALVRLMQRKEYSDIRITEICKEADIGRVTFYRHYDAIEDVLRKKCDEKCMGLVNYFKEYYLTHDRNEIFLKPHLRYWYSNSEIIRLIIRANKAHIISDSFEWMFNYLKQTMFKDRKLGKYQNYFVAVRAGVFISILKEWIKNDMNITPEELSRIIAEQTKETLSPNSLSIFFSGE